MSAFTNKEKRNFLLKKYIKEHVFDLFINLIINILLVALIIFVCKGTNYSYAVVFGVVYSLIQFLRDVYYYNKEYLKIDYPIESGN